MIAAQVEYVIVHCAGRGNRARILGGIARHRPRQFSRGAQEQVRSKTTAVRTIASRSGNSNIQIFKFAADGPGSEAILVSAVVNALTLRLKDAGSQRIDQCRL